VVLCAGAVGTPHLLMLSGVGDTQALASHGIRCKAHLPGVGQNMQDHLFCGVTFSCSTPTIAARRVGVRAVLQYLWSRSGLLTSNGLEATAFVRTGLRPDLHPAPDCQLHFVAASGDQRDQDNFGVLPEFQKDPADTRFGFTCFSTLLHPRSRGTVTLQSSDPFEHPAIDPHYLEHPDDVAVLRAGLRLSKRIMEHSTFDKVRGPAYRTGLHKTSPFADQFPAMDGDPLSLKDVADYSDEAWEWIIRHTAATVYHPAGTAKMGPRTDPMAVVDHKLQVLGGVSRLRVADASIMPEIVSGNTNAPSIMIGEKAAELIKAFPAPCARASL